MILILWVGYVTRQTWLAQATKAWCASGQQFQLKNFDPEILQTCFKTTSDDLLPDYKEILRLCHHLQSRWVMIEISKLVDEENTSTHLLQKLKIAYHCSRVFALHAITILHTYIVISIILPWTIILLLHVDIVIQANWPYYSCR